MEEVKYIPGDLVMFKNSFEPSDTCVGIVKFLGNISDIILLCPYTNLNLEYFIKEENIQGIPLTSEILEENGWFEDSFLDSYKSFYKNDRNYPSLHGQQTKDGYAFDIDIGETNIMTNVKYVHQLQHLLFGLGLNHEMEV